MSRLFLRRFVPQGLSSFCEDMEDTESDHLSTSTEAGGSTRDNAQPPQHEPLTATGQRCNYPSRAWSYTEEPIAPTRISSGQRVPRAPSQGPTTMARRPKSASTHINDKNRTTRRRNDGIAGAARPRSAGVGSVTISACRWAQRCNSTNSARPGAGGRCASPQKPHRAVRSGKGKGMPRTGRNKGSTTRSRRVWCGGQGVEAAWSYATTKNSDGDRCGVTRQIFVKVPCVKSNDSKPRPGVVGYQIAWHGGGGYSDRVNGGSFVNSQGIQPENLGTEQGSEAGENCFTRTGCNVEMTEDGRDLRSLLQGASLGETALRGESSFNDNAGYNNASVDDSPHTSRVLAQLRGSVGREQQRRWPSSPSPSEAAGLLRPIPSSGPPMNTGEAGATTTLAPSHESYANASSGRTAHGDEHVSCGHRLHPRSDIGKARERSFSKFRQPDMYLPPQRSTGTHHRSTRFARGRPLGTGPARAPAVRLRSSGGAAPGLPVMSEGDGIPYARASNIGRPVDNRRVDSKSVSKRRTDSAPSVDYSFFPCGSTEQQDGDDLSKIGSTSEERGEVSEWEESTFGISFATEAKRELGLDFGSPVPSEAVGW